MFVQRVQTRHACVSRTRSPSSWAPGNRQAREWATGALRFCVLPKKAPRSWQSTTTFPPPRKRSLWRDSRAGNALRSKQTSLGEQRSPRWSRMRASFAFGYSIFGPPIDQNSKAVVLTPRRLLRPPIRAAHPCHGVAWSSNRLVKQVGNMLRVYIPCADKTPVQRTSMAGLTSCAQTKCRAYVGHATKNLWSTNE
jgi:hypothetical protein